MGLGVLAVGIGIGGLSTAGLVPGPSVARVTDVAADPSPTNLLCGLLSNLICTPTPPTAPPTPTPSQSGSTSHSSSSTSSGPHPVPPTAPVVPGAHAGPFPAPPPPLPSPPAGAPPAPPSLAVQRLTIAAASTDPVPPGSQVLIQVTCEATQGSNLYSVPHAPVSLSILAAPGRGAAVSPASGDCGDLGTLQATVTTGDASGTTLVQAASGSVSGQLAIASTEAAATPSPTAAPPLVGVITGPSGGIGRAAAAAGAGLAVLLVGAVTLLARARGLPLPFLRRRVWGRRSIERT